MNNTLPCLVIIDMQKGMADPAAGARNNPHAEDNIARLLAAWRAASAHVVHVRHISRSPTSPFAPGQPGVLFQEALQPLAHEHVVEKNVPDAFINTALERWLRVRGVNDIVVAGVSTNNSVEASARTAGNLGFKTTVVSTPALPSPCAITPGCSAVRTRCMRCRWRISAVNTRRSWIRKPCSGSPLLPSETRPTHAIASNTVNAKAPLFQLFIHEYAWHVIFIYSAYIRQYKMRYGYK